MEDIKKNISDNLILLRKTQKLTQQKLASEFHYSDKAVSRWETGDSLPDISVLLALCEFYGVDFDWLIHRHDTAPKKTVGDSDNGIKIAVVLLCAAVAFTFATLIFVYNRIMNASHMWVAFVWAVPVSLVFAIYFSRRWWSSLCTTVLVSAWIWSVLTGVYLTMLPVENVWPLFLIGIPIEIIVLLLNYIRHKNR